MVLLHGFPDSGRLWRHQVPALAEAGSRSSSPTCGATAARTSRPRSQAYAMPALVGDVLAVMTTRAPRGPMWSGTTGARRSRGRSAFVAADHVDHLVALSVGHPATFRADGFEQYEKSWYMLLFQFAGIAEEWLSANDWANFRAWAVTPTRRGDRRAGGERLAHPGAQLLPREHPAGVATCSRAWSCRRSRPRPWACGARATSP